VHGKLEMMMANELHGIPKLLSSKKSSFDRDRNHLSSSFSGIKVNLLHSKNAASDFSYGKFSSVIQRNKTKRFLVTSTLADVANDFMVNSLSFH
jgi:hypothetical protein